MSMRRPRQLLSSVRRFETNVDARGFIIGCGIMWGIGWVINSALWYLKYSNDPRYDPDFQSYFMSCILQFIAAPVILWALLHVVSTAYYKMAINEAGSKFDELKVYNLMAYAMGPSLLAVIPMIGMPLAALWIMALLIFVGTAGLKLRSTGAIVLGLLAFIMIAVGAAAIYLVGNFAWDQITSGGGLPLKPPPPPSNHPA
jgi:hypothetical protein